MGLGGFYSLFLFLTYVLFCFRSFKFHIYCFDCFLISFLHSFIPTYISPLIYFLHLITWIFPVPFCPSFFYCLSINFSLSQILIDSFFLSSFPHFFPLSFFFLFFHFLVRLNLIFSFCHFFRSFLFSFFFFFHFCFFQNFSMYFFCMFLLSFSFSYYVSFFHSLSFSP